MKSYPSIPRLIQQNQDIFAFAKIDGSNIRAEWSQKNRCWTKFGSRTRLLSETDKTLGEAIRLIKNDSRYALAMEKFFGSFKGGKEGGMAYFEFYGQNSFAGQHVDEIHDVILFDVEVKKQGLIGPEEFLLNFGQACPCAQLLYQGPADEAFIKRVKEGTLPGMPPEGVVCKASPTKKWAQPTMFKIKSDSWISKVKVLYKDPVMLDKLL